MKNLIALKSDWSVRYTNTARAIWLTSKPLRVSPVIAIIPTVSDRVLIDRQGDVLVLTMNRPAVLNALDFELLDELAQALKVDGKDASAVVLKGAGSRAFSAGFDLGRLEGTESDLRADDSIGAAVEAIRSCPAPVIASIRGHCHGAAVELALSCDLRVAADDLQMSIRAVGLGVVYRFELFRLLVQLCGLGHAQDLLLAMPVLDAARAYDWGLLTEVAPAAELDSRVQTLALALAAAPRAAVAGTKATFRLLQQELAAGALAAKADELRVQTSSTAERHDALHQAKRRLRKTRG